jgi:hypothetical protein
MHVHELSGPKYDRTIHAACMIGACTYYNINIGTYTGRSTRIRTYTYNVPILYILYKDRSISRYIYICYIYS